MGNTPSVTQLAEQEQIWGFLPDPALERVFANMQVTTLLRVLENTTNDHLKEIAVSNIVWKKRYEHLYIQLVVMAIIFCRRGYTIPMNDQNNRI